MQENKTLSVISGENLLALDIDPPRFIVARLLPTGLHLLAGSPKIGKSWLALWLCHQVSVGGKVWEFDTQKCGALYISLEDTLDRLHLRLSRITENGSKDIFFTTSADNLAGNLIAQLESFMKEYPDTGLIVIDTFQRIRDSENESTYANDYKEMVKVKAMADKCKIAVLLVHHLRKAPDSDPFNMVSGSTGIIGAVDSIYVLEKNERVENTAVLHITGRDIEDMDLKLEFDKETTIWKFLGYESGDNKSGNSLITAIASFVTGAKTFSGTASELLDKLKAVDGTIALTPNALSRSLKEHALTLEKGHKITQEFKRTNNSRVITLSISDGDDAFRDTPAETISSLNVGSDDVSVSIPHQ